MNIIPGYWLTTKDGDPRAYALFKRHYSFHQYGDNRRLVGRNRRLFVGPGEKLVLLGYDCLALFVWRKFISTSFEAGVNCAVFRNESDRLSSILILEAEEHAWRRWPGQRLYTYVNGKQVGGDGLCFKKAGWKKLKRRTKVNGLIVLEKLP
jgi:hypothetical protein